MACIFLTLKSRIGEEYLGSNGGIFGWNLWWSSKLGKIIISLK
jgi:hypothetical protein